MLTPKLIPLESEFTESDLKPGLRVRRKSDGAECVVRTWRDTSAGELYFSVFLGDAVIERYPGTCWMQGDRMLDWLRSDFTPIEPRYKTVGELPPGTVFDTKAWKYVYRTNFIESGGCVACVDLDAGETTLSFKPEQEVTHIHGKLVFVRE